MNRSTTPSLGELSAFAAAARHVSFSRAAVELNLTQGAISRLIRQLEGKLQTRLFERIRQRVILTDTGRIFALEVQDVLAKVSDATQRIRAAQDGVTTLNIVVLPSFGNLWLIPRLSGFLAENPTIRISVAARINPWDAPSGKYDIAIHYGAPVWAGAIVHYLMDEDVYPVCSPAYRKKNRLAAPPDLRRAQLIQLATRPHAWAAWFERQGLSSRHAYWGPSFGQHYMTLQAVIHDMGVALLPSFMIERELKNGSAEILFDRPLRNDQAYFLAVPEARADVAAPFVDWMLRQCAQPVLRRIKSRIR